MADPRVHYEESGVTLLSQQSAFAPNENRRKKDPTWPATYAHLEGQLAMDRNWRLSWWTHWSLLARYILPRRYHWLITANKMSRGSPLNQDIVDGTGTLAMRTCYAGLMEGLTSPNRPWLKFVPAISNFEPDRAGQLWLDDLADRVRYVHAESNFYDSLGTMYQDLVVFGTAPVIDYEDKEDLVRAFNPCAGEYFCQVSAAMRPEAFTREFTLTIKQVIDQFGVENVPPDIAMLWEQKGGALANERIVAHVIEPNFPIKDKRGQAIRPVDAKWPWREIYWMRGLESDAPLSKRGFFEQPHAVARWETVSNDPYGRSPGMDALPDIMQLQVETKRKAEAIEKHVRPPMLASVSLKNEPSSILPGHVTYVQTLGPGEGMRPAYEVNPNLAPMVEDIREIQKRIEAAFYNDLFRMISQLETVRTATEIDARREEKLVLLGPVIERLQNECLSPRIRRHVSIMERKDLIPPRPQSLFRNGQPIPIKIDYISSLTMAQRAASTASIERTYAFVGNMSAVYPEAKDNLDPDATIRVYGDQLSTPQKIFTDRQKMAQIREQRAQQQQAMQMGQAAGAAAQGAQVLSQTQVGGGINALQAMLGNQGAGPEQ